MARFEKGKKYDVVDAEVEFIRSINHSNKIIFKVGDNGTMADLVYP